MVWAVCKCLKQAFIRLSLKNFKVINVVRQLRLIRGIGQIKQKIGLLFFFLGEGATGITVIKDDLNESIYNLAGQRMSKMQKGVNIVGGKKVLY